MRTASIDLVGIPPSTDAQKLAASLAESIQGDADANVRSIKLRTSFDRTIRSAAAFSLGALEVMIAANECNASLPAEECGVSASWEASTADGRRRTQGTSAVAYSATVSVERAVSSGTLEPAPLNASALAASLGLNASALSVGAVEGFEVMNGDESKLAMLL